MQGFNTFIPDGYQMETASKQVTQSENLVTPLSKL